MGKHRSWPFLSAEQNFPPVGRSWSPTLCEVRNQSVSGASVPSPSEAAGDRTSTRRRFRRRGRPDIGQPDPKHIPLDTAGTGRRFRWQLPWEEPTIPTVGFLPEPTPLANPALPLPRPRCGYRPACSAGGRKKNSRDSRNWRHAEASKPIRSGCSAPGDAIELQPHRPRRRHRARTAGRGRDRPPSHARCAGPGHRWPGVHGVGCADRGADDA